MILDRFALTGRVAVVTGASGFIGRAIAVALAEAGADLVLTARSVDKLEATAALVREGGRRALVVPCDVSDSGHVEAMAAAAERELGRIDILVNNAGGPVEGYAVPLEDVTDEQWRDVMATNLAGAFYCARAIVPGMAERGRGAVVNISSAFGVRASRNNYFYPASKGGLNQLTRSLAVTYASKGVRANTVAPGLVPHTEAMAEAFHHGKFVPLGRMATGEEIGRLVVFVASDAAPYLNGATITSDGGGLASGAAPTGWAPSRSGGSAG